MVAPVVSTTGFAQYMNPTLLVSAAQSAKGVTFPGHFWGPNEYQSPVKVTGGATPSGGGGGAPGFLSNYQLDGDLKIANNVAYGMIGTGVGGLAGIGAGAAIGVVGWAVGAGGLATNIAGGLVGGMVGSKVGGAIGGIAGELGQGIGSFFGGLTGGILFKSRSTARVPRGMRQHRVFRGRNAFGRR
jgi:hypothetical protein